jgi:ABC-type uncharacterized transport system auxiliary subunit
MLKKIVKTSPIIAMLAGCSVFQPVSVPDIHTYELAAASSYNAQAPVECSDSNLSTKALQVSPVHPDVPYDSSKMFYSLSPYELDSYASNQWVSLPSSMLTQAIQQRIIQACYYASVVSSDFMTVTKYRLTTQLVNFKQVINGNDTKFMMTVIAQLIDNKTNQVLKAKTFNIEEKVTADPKGYVSGANAATNKFLDQLIVWLKN